MRYVIISILIGCFTTTIAQEEQSSNFSIGVHFSPTYNYRLLKSNATTDLVKEIRDQEEIANFGYRTGVTIAYGISTKFNLQSGLFFANRVYRTRTESLNWVDPNISAATETFRSRQFQYIEIPLYVQYTFFQKERVHVFAELGGVASLNYRNFERNHVNINGDWEITSLDSPNLSHTIFMLASGIGAEYKISPRIKLRGAILFQQAITPVNRDLPTKELLNSGGLNFGLIFSSKKNSTTNR